MAEKTVSVRLKLIHDQYMKAAAEAGKATDNVAKADKWKQLGKETAGLGDKLSRNVTLPIVGVGIAAVKMSGDFDKAFVNMQTLAGTSASEIDGLKESVLGLAGETGKAPQELAEALYFIKSSGFAGKEALDALEMSAKGAAAGLGSTIQVADAVTSAINGYGKANLTAARATDILVATAQQGKAEASELAPQFGRLIPIAAELGITFDQVGAGMAFLTRASGDASLASTQMAGILAKLLDSGVEGAEALEAVGSSAEELRRSVREKGLLPALIELRDNLEANGLTLADFSRDQQFLQGALQLTGASAEEAKAVFKALEDSAGATDKAFETWADNMGAKNAQAWAKFQVALIRLGDTLAPIASDVIGFAAAMLEWFEKLPGPVKQVAGALVVMAAAAGPLLSVGGRVMQIWASAMKIWESFATSGGRAFADAMNAGTESTNNMASGASRLKTALGAAGVVGAVVAVGLALKAWNDANHAKNIEETAKAFSGLGKGAERAMQELVTVADVGNQTDEVFRKILESDTAAASRFIKTAESLGMEKEALNELRGELQAKIEADRQSEKDQKANTASVKDGTSAFDEEAAAITQAVEALQGYSDALQASFDPLFGVLDATNAVRDARLAVDDATRALTEAEKEQGKGSAEAAEAQRELSAAHDDAVRAALGLESAQIELARAVENGEVSLGDATEMMAAWVKSGYITEAEASALIAKFADYAGKVRSVPRAWNTHLSTTGVEDSIHDIAFLQAKINALEGRDVKLRIVGTAVGVKIPGGGLMATGGPVRKNTGYIVGEKGPEWFEPEQNGRIVPNHLLGSMVPQSALGGSGAGGGTARVVIDLTGGDAMFMSWLKNRVRIEGRGDVQVALGQKRQR